MDDDEVDLDRLLTELDEKVKKEIASTPTVEDWDEDTFDVEAFVAMTTSDPPPAA